MKNHTSQNREERNYILIFLAILSFWFLVLITSESLFSGYHFTDDHEVVVIHHSLNLLKQSFIETIIQWLQYDNQSARMRPFYFIYRVFETNLFGLNFYLWSIHNGILATLTTFFLFIFARLFKFSYIESLFFAFLSTLGPQSAAWWRLGYAEALGMFLLSLALVTAGLSTHLSRHKPLYQATFILATVLMSLCKESFILLIPGVAFIKVFLFRAIHCSSWLQALKKNIISLSIVFFIFLGELLFIKHFVGLKPKISYAGVDEFKISNFFTAAKTFYHQGFGFIITISIILLFSSILLKGRNFAKNSNQALSSLAAPVLLSVIIIVPQLILHSKSGVSQRYFFPGIIGSSFLVVSVYKNLNAASRNPKKIILLLVSINLLLNLNLVWNDARVFALEGKSTNALLEAIKANTDPKDPILLATNARVYQEWNASIKKYLNQAINRSNLYINVYGEKTSFFYQELTEIYSNKTLETLPNKDQIQCIIVFPELNNAFLRRSAGWFVKTNYQAYVFGHFNRNLNPNSEIYLYCKK